MMVTLSPIHCTTVYVSKEEYYRDEPIEMLRLNDYQRYQTEFVLAAAVIQLSKIRMQTTYWSLKFALTSLLT